MIHDEIPFFGRTLIVDTAALPNYGRAVCGHTVYETMAMYQDGHDLRTLTADSEEDARRNHAELLDMYCAREREREAEERHKKDHPLPGKYAKLRDDLKAAFAETAYLEQTEDGGTCNFDAPALKLPRWNGKLIERAAEEAGGGAWKWELWGSSRWVIGFPSSGQGNRRSRRADALVEVLRRMGYACTEYCAMD